MPVLQKLCTLTAGGVLHKWLMAVCFEGRPECGPVIIGKTSFFLNDEIKIIGRCTFSDGWLRSSKKIWPLCVLFDKAECMVLWHLSGLVIAGLKEFCHIMFQV